MRPKASLKSLNHFFRCLRVLVQGRYCQKPSRLEEIPGGRVLGSSQRIHRRSTELHACIATGHRRGHEPNAMDELHVSVYTI